MAHDVNNMLAVVALVASSLRARLGPDERDLADELVDSAVHAAKLNRRLLLVGRQDPIRREDVDLNAIVEGMRRDCSNASPATRWNSPSNSTGIRASFGQMRGKSNR